MPSSEIFVKFLVSKLVTCHSMPVGQAVRLPAETTLVRNDVTDFSLNTQTMNHAVPSSYPSLPSPFVSVSSLLSLPLFFSLTLLFLPCVVHVFRICQYNSCFCVSKQSFKFGHIGLESAGVRWTVCCGCMSDFGRKERGGRRREERGRCQRSIK